MKTILLEGSRMTDRYLSHLYIKESFDFPFYYGRNLDALFDMLTSIDDPTEIRLIDRDLLTENMGAYGESLIQVFLDAEELNSNIKFIME